MPDQLLGEYAGVFIPYDSQTFFGDDIYAMAFEIAAQDDVTGEVIGEQKAVATVVAGERGNWTRFLNHRGRGEANCRFMTEILGGKRRITVRAVRKVGFGEELTVDYGVRYGFE